MSLIKSLSTVAVIGAAASAASAAIIPSWRVNTISPAAITNDPQLAGAISVSLLVSLTGDSLFNVAGLDLTGLFPGASVAIYNNAAGSNNAPNPVLIPVLPALEFDTYVTNSNRTDSSIPGRLNGTGAAVFGPDTFNVAWGATPNTGPTGGSNMEVARITFLASSGLFVDTGGTAIPAANGQVRDSLNPNDAIGLPPIPVAIPEPTMGLALAGLGLLALRRK